VAVSEAGHAAARAIDDLYRSHAREVYRYALAVLGQPADAEDVTQTTFLNAYRSLESGVRPRKPENWLLAIASNVIKQRFRAEQARPRQALLGDPAAERSSEDAAPTIGELMTALAQIPPLQRQAIVLREFEGRSYREIAEILGVTTSALETLLFRARKSLSEEMESQLTCTEAQHAVSRAADGRLGRKERRRLRGHLEECPDCARFARVQQRNRRALRGLALVPVPVLDWPFKGLEAPATAALGVPAASVTAAAVGSGGAAGVIGGSVALKTAAVVTAASVAGGVGIVGGAEIERKDVRKTPIRVEAVERPGKRLGQVVPRGVTVPGLGVAAGRTNAATKPGARVGPAGERVGEAPGIVKQADRARPVAGRTAPAKGRSAEARAKPPARKAAENALGLPHVPTESARARGRDTPTRGSPAQSRRGGDRNRCPPKLIRCA
jgi:RNA polymerase sigma-70 factor (ECF subfamily)